MGAHSSSSAGQRAATNGTARASQCWDYRQSVGQNHRKRGLKGFDGYKRVNGRKRHLLVDTQGLVLEVVISAANVSDQQAVSALFASAISRSARLTHVWADRGYVGSLKARMFNRFGIRIQIATRSQFATSHYQSPHRWVVERTFAWLGRYRRLSKDYEFLPETSRAMILAAMSCLMLKRLARL